MATISDEIKRIQGAKASIKSSIENKGVTVPSDAHLEEYPSYINKIEGGGGGGQSFKYVDNVSFNDYGMITGMRFTGSEIPSLAYEYSKLVDVEFTDNLRTIARGAFQSNYSLIEVNIPDSVTSIEQYAFSYCSGLKNVHLPSGINIINDYVFQSCSGLTEISIPDSVTSIKGSAFQNCSGLTEVNIPENVTSMGSSVFNQCISLKGATVLPTTPPTLGNNAVFDNTGMCPIYVKSNSLNNYKTAQNWSKYANRIVPIGWEYNYSSGTELRYSGETGTTNFTHLYKSIITYQDASAKGSNSLNLAYIGDEVTEIGERAFESCRKLSFVNISDNSRLEKIGEKAFYNCEIIKSINIPNGVTSIGNQAFIDCDNLKEIKIGTEITSIGDLAFYSCEKLEKVYVKADTPPTLGNYVFDNTNNCPIYVPENSVDVYKTAPNWSTYADRIQGYNFN